MTFSHQSSIMLKMLTTLNSVIIYVGGLVWKNEEYIKIHLLSFQSGHWNKRNCIVFLRLCTRKIVQFKPKLHPKLCDKNFEVEHPLQNLYADNRSQQTSKQHPSPITSIGLSLMTKKTTKINCIHPSCLEKLLSEKLTKQIKLSFSSSYFDSINNARLLNLDKKYLSKDPLFTISNAILVQPDWKLKHFVDTLRSNIFKWVPPNISELANGWEIALDGSPLNCLYFRCCRFQLFNTDIRRKFWGILSLPPHWFHLVVVVYGFEDGQGMVVFINSVLSKEIRTEKITTTYVMKEMQTRVGGNWDIHIHMDNLAIWLKELTQTQISALYLSGERNQLVLCAIVCLCAKQRVVIQAVQNIFDWKWDHVRLRGWKPGQSSCTFSECESFPVAEVWSSPSNWTAGNPYYSNAFSRVIGCMQLNGSEITHDGQVRSSETFFLCWKWSDTRATNCCFETQWKRHARQEQGPKNSDESSECVRFCCSWLWPLEAQSSYPVPLDWNRSRTEQQRRSPWVSGWIWVAAQVEWLHSFLTTMWECGSNAKLELSSEYTLSAQPCNMKLFGCSWCLPVAQYVLW